MLLIVFTFSTLCIRRCLLAYVLKHVCTNVYHSTTATAHTAQWLPCAPLGAASVADGSMGIVVKWGIECDDENDGYDENDDDDGDDYDVNGRADLV